MSTTDLGARDAAFAGSTPVPAKPETPAKPEWHNLRAPDARTTLTAAVTVPAGRRELRVFLRNPNALFGIVVLVHHGRHGASSHRWYFPAIRWAWSPSRSSGRARTPPIRSAATPWAATCWLVSCMARASRCLSALPRQRWAYPSVCWSARLPGYFGGWVDDVLVRIVEIFQTLPNFVLLVVLVAILQPSATTVTIAIAIVSWPMVARLTRAEFRAIREKDYVMAARSLGFGDARIIFQEMLPNALPPLIVTVIGDGCDRHPDGIGPKLHGSGRS